MRHIPSILGASSASLLQWPQHNCVMEGNCCPQVNPRNPVPAGWGALGRTTRWNCLLSCVTVSAGPFSSHNSAEWTLLRTDNVVEQNCPLIFVCLYLWSWDCFKFRNWSKGLLIRTEPTAQTVCKLTHSPQKQTESLPLPLGGFGSDHETNFAGSRCFWDCQMYSWSHKSSSMTTSGTCRATAFPTSCPWTHRFS